MTFLAIVSALNIRQWFCDLLRRPDFKEADFASLTGAVRGDAISVAIKPFVKPVATLFLLFACHLFWNILINKLSIFNL
jgi:hypothetical protein